ncbi:hypothetical protein HDU80_000607 [Chytriomyces hyalinus]|nr:hypothetical protein HDU80_000607 [Chytriomyces hyalinus]
MGANGSQQLAPSEGHIQQDLSQQQAQRSNQSHSHKHVFDALLDSAQRAKSISHSHVANWTGVKVFVASGNDFIAERDVLVSFVWPFLASFCAVLGLDFEVADLDWNVPEAAIHGNRETERSINKLKSTLGKSTISIFIGLLGDKYGPTALPSSITSDDFEAIRSHLLSIPETAKLVPQLMDVWYTRDDNASPNPIHVLQPVTAILPAFSANSTNSSLEQQEAAELWMEIREALSHLLGVGAIGCFGVEVAAEKGFGKSLTDLLVSFAFATSSGNVASSEGLFCFQRTLLDLKRNAPKNFASASAFIDMNPTTEDLKKERINHITRLRSRHRASRFYAIPWRSDPNPLIPQEADGKISTTPIGFNPLLDKTHATYLATFCEDVAKLVCESIVKQYAAGSVLGSGRDRLGGLDIAGEVGREVVKHGQLVIEKCDGFVGREDVLGVAETFLEEEAKKVLVLYGAAGVGKTSLMAKISDLVTSIQPDVVNVTRFIGTTSDSLDSRSLLRSICSQIVHVYGLEALKDIVEAESGASFQVAETTGEQSLEEKLGNLDHWPPTSIEGLTAGFEICLKLAEVDRPLVVILDGVDELSIQDDARTLDWLPRKLPDHVKLIISTAPTSRTTRHPTFSILSTTYPTTATSNQHLEVPFMVTSEVAKLVDSLMARSGRTLQPSQKQLLIEKCNAQKLPLYVIAAWTLYARKWTSTTSPNIIATSLDAETVPGLLEDFLEALEGKLGKAFVAKSIGYLSAARHGTSRMELEDLVSCDETAMNEILKFQDSCVRRIPPIYVERLLEELGDCVVQRHVFGVNGIFWSHPQFQRVAQDRYLEQGQSSKIHSSIANYWEAKYANQPKQFYDPSGVARSESRYIIDQSLLISGRPNLRRISALVWHQLAIAPPQGFRRAVKTLQDISFLGAAIHAGLLWDVLASFRFAISLTAEEGSDEVSIRQLKDYYRFLLSHAEDLLSDPNRLVPVAANLYSGSVVADEARSWILSNVPGLNWVEWVNRPAARGEPIVTLRGTDANNDPNDVMLVTGRDTYDERILLVGVRTVDNQPTAVLYDMEQVEASGVGGGKAKVLAKMNLKKAGDKEIIEEGVPLVASFSRTGHLIAVGARSCVILDGRDLTVKKIGVDSTLSANDLITAIAWTNNDGCIVTASDGAEPGRIGLWDAESVTLLQVIQASDPRQPIASAFNTLAFWDEDRDLFVTLNVDELVMDSDSKSYLHFIPNKAHSDPPPDCCARFGISFEGAYVILAEENGKGYLLVDTRVKKPVARLDMPVDRVRTISISHDGKRVAVVPNDGKVIFIHGIPSGSKPSKETGLYTFQHLGTILGVDPSLSDGGSQVGCIFSRSGKTVLTDGEFGSVRVWSIDELGDHSTVRFSTTLAEAYQTVIAVRGGGASGYLGWAVNEGHSVVSFADKKVKATLQTTAVSSERTARKPGFSRKDLVTGVACHLTKPIVGSVTNNGNLTLIYAEQAFHEKGWSGALKSVFNKRVGGGGYAVTLNVMKQQQQGAFISPSALCFLDSASAVANGIVAASASEILSFAVGYEDGTVAFYDWVTSNSLSQLVPTVILDLRIGRITSITPTNIPTCRRVALTVDDSTVVLWEGLADVPEQLHVLVSPFEVSESYISMKPAEKRLANRRSTSSIMSITGLLDRNSDRPVAVAYSSTQEQLLATSETDGMITIWNTEAKVKRSLLIHSTDVFPAPVTAIAWAADDAAIISLTEDKRISIHNTVTGNIVWLHDLWMISPRVNAANFTPGARDLAILDHEGAVTTLQLHGDWPTAVNADVFSPIKMNTASSTRPGVGSKSGFPQAPDPEFAVFAEWGPAVTDKILEARAVKNGRSAFQWEPSSGSNVHGHVALIRIGDGLPRGAYEVVCNVEIPERIDGEPGYVPLKFLCWTTVDADVVDPELDVIHGFTRLLPAQEQEQLAGKGNVTLRLGYIKTSTRLETCCIDLTRVPGDGTPIEFGDVHFIPVNPRLYRPDFVPADDLVDAFDHLSVDFDEFELAQGRQTSVAQVATVEQVHQEEFPDLMAPTPSVTSKAAKRNTFVGALASFSQSFTSASIVEKESDGGEVMFDIDGDSEAQDTVQNFVIPSVEASRRKKANNRKSLLQSITSVGSGVSGVVGGILTSAVSALPTASVQTRAKGTPEDIMREMEEARKRGMEQARMFEEAEEFKAAQAARQREWMGRKLEFEQDARRKAALIRMQREADYGEFRASPELYMDEDGDDFDLEGVDEDVKREAQRMMRELLQQEMAQDLGVDAADL